MGISSKEFSELIFQQTIQGNTGKLDLDGEMINVLLQLDGTQNLGQVAEQCGLTLAALRPIMAKLAKHKLIKHLKPSVATVDLEFISFLTHQLSMALGPLGEIVLEDGLEDLGYTKSNLPTTRAAELVNLLAEEIIREEKRIQFKQNMLEKIRKYN